MGAGASLDTAAVLTKAEAMAAAGDQWDEAKWEAAAEGDIETARVASDRFAEHHVTAERAQKLELALILVVAGAMALKAPVTRS